MESDDNKALLRRFYAEIDAGNIDAMDELPGPLPATGAELRQTAVAIHRIADGRLAEHWSDRDDLALMQQLGVISPPSG